MHQHHGDTQQQSTDDVTDQRRDHRVPDVFTDTDVGAVQDAHGDIVHVDDNVLEAEKDKDKDWEMKDDDFRNNISSTGSEPNCHAY